MLSVFFAAGGITVRVAIRCGKRCGIDMRFCKNQSCFVFLTSDSISQPRGEGDFAIHYTIKIKFWRVLRRFFFLYINVATCER
jgi:hypothetical protein